MTMKGGEEKMEQRLILKRYTCEKCGHSWLPRSERRPRMCPGCQTVNWDVPLIQENGNQ